MATQTILVVEDEKNILDLLLFTLRRDNHTVTGAKSGEEAITILGRKTFDLVILDIMLPQKNGFEVLNFLQTATESPDTPVILLSALASPETIVRGLDGGAVDYITKPFSINELSARVRLHLQLKATNDELHQAIAAKEKFFNIIAHDLRGPSAAIHSYAMLLAKTYNTFDDDKRQRSLNTMLTASGHLNKLLENLLEWAQTHTGHIQLHRQSVNLRGVAVRVIDLLQTEAAQKQVTLRLEIAPEHTVFADPSMLETVFRNLLGNGIKFSRPGGQVSLSSQSHEEHELITVTDSGIGIRKVDLDKLFRIDVHHATPGTNNEKGTGLGLILCKEFIEQNGGTISAASEENKGSIFRITLPLAVSETQPVKEPVTAICAS